MTWVRGKHTFKFGAEVYFQEIAHRTISGVTLATGTIRPRIPSLRQVVSTDFSTGFGFASWLLGDYSSSCADSDGRSAE